MRASTSAAHRSPAGTGRPSAWMNDHSIPSRPPSDTTTSVLDTYPLPGDSTRQVDAAYPLPGHGRVASPAGTAARSSLATAGPCASAASGSGTAGGAAGAAGATTGP